MNWVFDLDGTLVDSHSSYFASLAYVLEQNGSTLTDEDRLEVLRISSKDREKFFAKKIGAGRVRGAMAALSERVTADLLEVKPFDGIPELLRTIHASGAGIAVWTARELDSAVEVLSLTGLDRWISVSVSGSCVERCKPDPEGLLKLAAHFKCPPSSLIMVGDHDNDMRAAAACGAKPIRAKWLAPETSFHCEISAHQFSRVDQLKSWHSAL